MLRERTIDLLKKHDISLSKKEGQSHLVKEDILERMVENADISRSDVVLEIGPGIGNLTSLLVERAQRVFAVERDEELAEVLEERFRDEENLEIVKSDVLETDLPSFDKIVSNLPYSISSPLTFKLLEEEFESGILMYQKEFAQRMVASPGSQDYSRLSVNVYYRARAEVLEKVPPNVFLPEPEVWSAIVELRPRKPPFEVLNEETFFATVRACFQHRRQKIRNGLIHSFREIFPGHDLSDGERREFIDESVPSALADKRPGKTTPEEFGKIADSLEENLE